MSEGTRVGYPSDMSDAQWEQLAPLIPPKVGKGRNRTVDLREILNAISLWTGWMIGGVTTNGVTRTSRNCRLIWTMARRSKVIERNSSNVWLTGRTRFNCRLNWCMIRHTTASTIRWNIAGASSNDMGAERC